MLAIYEGQNEVLIFAVNADGKHIGVHDYFGPGNRSVDDYDISIVNAPIEITHRAKVSASQTF